MINFTDFKILESVGVPDIIKDIFKDNIFDLNNLKFTKCSYNYDLDKYLKGVKLKLNIKINKSVDESYNGDINFYEILENGFDKTTINLDIKTKKINKDRLKTVLFHELTHLYELHNINEYVYKSDWYYQKNLIDFKKENTNIGLFKYFIDLIYVSFDQEIRARNAELYDFLITRKTSNDLRTEIKNSNAYLKYQNLMNFEYMNIINFYKTANRLDQLIEFVNILNQKFDKKTIINNEKDLIKYFKKWNFHFKDSAKKSLKNMHRVADKANKDKLSLKKIVANKKLHEQMCRWEPNIEIPPFFGINDINFINSKIKGMIRF